MARRRSEKVCVCGVHACALCLGAWSRTKRGRRVDWIEQRRVRTEASKARGGPDKKPIREEEGERRSGATTLRRGEGQEKRTEKEGGRAAAGVLGRARGGCSLFSIT